jgi:hypothetical protein
MQSVRIQLTVDSEMSLEFARLDMSKPSDSHGQLSWRKELRGAALPGADVPCSGQKKEAGRVRCYRAPGGARQCDEVKAMAASGTITRASLL